MFAVTVAPSSRVSTPKVLVVSQRYFASRPRNTFFVGVVPAAEAQVEPQVRGAVRCARRRAEDRLGDLVLHEVDAEPPHPVRLELPEGGDPQDTENEGRDLELPIRQTRRGVPLRFEVADAHKGYVTILYPLSSGALAVLAND